MFKSLDWVTIITFKEFKELALKRNSIYVLPDKYEAIGESIIGYIDDDFKFRPVKFSRKAKAAIFKK